MKVGASFQSFASSAKAHLPLVEGLLVRRGREPFPVRVPDLDRGVQVEHVMVMAPGHDLAAVDVPGEIDEQPPGREVLGEDRSKVLRGDAPPEIADPLRRPGGQGGLLVLEVQDRDLVAGYLHVPEQDRQRALCHGAVPEDQHLLLELQCPTSLSKILAWKLFHSCQ